MRTEYCPKSNPSWVSCGALSRVRYIFRYIACPKLTFLAGNTFARGLLFTKANRESPKQNQCTRQNEKKNKETCKDDVTREDSQRRFLLQPFVAKLKQQRMLVSTTSTSSRTRSAILRTAHPFCASPRFQVVVSSCTTTSSHQKLEVGRTTDNSWFSKVNSYCLMHFLFVSSLSLSS